MKLYQAVILIVLAGIANCYAQLVVPPVTAECATSVDGTVVGTPNPLNPPNGSVIYSGTLGPGTYYIEIAWYDANGNVTLPSPEIQLQLTATGSLQISPPDSGMPASAAGSQIFIGTTSGGETLQGTVAGSATYTQSGPLTTGQTLNIINALLPGPTTGNPLPTVNTTICQVIANDAGWPTGTGYNVSLTTPAGQTLPGYPMQWQLLGPGLTINLSQGLPLYNGTVTYPIPLLARPYNHAPQSMSGPFSIGGYAFGAGAATFTGLVQLLDGGVFSGTFSGGPTFDFINFTQGIKINGSYGSAGACLQSTGSGSQWSTSACGVGGATTASLNFAGGAGAVVSLASGSADKSGRIVLTTGTGTSIDALLTVTFSTPYTTASFCTITAGEPNSAAAIANVFVNSLRGAFQMYTTGAPLAASTGYQWNYVCNGH